MTPMATDGKPKRRNQQVFADPCPHCGSNNTRVRKTERTIRRCYCLACRGKGWKQFPKE